MIDQCYECGLQIHSKTRSKKLTRFQFSKRLLFTFFFLRLFVLRSFRADLNPMGWFRFDLAVCYFHTLFTVQLFIIYYTQTFHVPLSLFFVFHIFSRCVAYIEDERLSSLCDGNYSYSSGFNAHFSIKFIKKIFCFKSSVCSESK